MEGRKQEGKEMGYGQLNDRGNGTWTGRQRATPAIGNRRQLEAESECPSFRAKIMMLISTRFSDFFQSFCVEGNKSARSYACADPAWTRGSARNEKA